MWIMNDKGHTDFQKYKVHCRKEKEQVNCCLKKKNGATVFDRLKDRKQNSGNSIGDVQGKGPSVFRELQ